ncbi:MAG: dihydrofolate reductase family protein [Rikenellaceae bacterium]
MRTMLSVATSADSYIDDMSPNRLVLSTAEDWEQIYELRRSHDAILIGAETLRRDNPTLRTKDIGREPRRIIVSSDGYIDPSLRIFHQGESPVILFSTTPRPELEALAEVVLCQKINAAHIITELERRGINSLFVEGGSQILEMFLVERLADDVRIARNPAVRVADRSAPRFVPPLILDTFPHTEQNLGGMEVSTYHLIPNLSKSDHIYMQRAVDISRLSPPCASCYRVGAVVVTRDGAIFEGYTHEGSPTHHAEQIAIYKALEAGADLSGGKIYASLEPCSSRSSEGQSCSELILEHGFSHVLFAMYEPSCFVCCQGAYNLRRARVRVDLMAEYAPQVMEINSHLNIK